MKRLLIGVLIASCAMLLVGAASAQVKTPAVKSAEVKGEGHHDLMSLDLREAAEHARVLNHYVKTHAKNLEKDVLAKHLDEMTRNLDGIKDELGKVEEKMGASAANEPRIALIRKEEDSARQEMDALKQALAADKLDPVMFTEHSQLLYQAMANATEHHKRLMAKRGVTEPAGPVTKR